MTVASDLEARLAAVDIHSIDRYETEGYPWADWDLLRDVAPVYRYERDGIAPFWALTRYEHVKLRRGSDDGTFINGGPRLRLASEAPRSADVGGQVQAGRPLRLGSGRAVRHGVLRRPPPHRVPAAGGQGLHPVPVPDHGRFARLARGLASSTSFEAKLAAGDPVDLVEDLAVPLPLATICEMMGVPVDDWADIHRWTDSAFDTPSTRWARPGESRADMRRRLRIEFFDYIDELIARKRAEPGDDLTTTLVEAEVGSGALTQQQLHGYLTLLIAAGNETTRNAISRGVVALLEHPDELDRLLDDPDRHTDTAVEEIVRWTSPVIQFARTATRDVELAGQTIRAGDTVGLWYPSANRDERQFDEPYRFDVGRSPNYHVGFGHGPHFCLGANLARWELRAMFGELARRDLLSNLALDGPAEWMTDLHVGALTDQPVALRA